MLKETVVNFLIDAHNNNSIITLRDFFAEHPLLLISVLGLGTLWALGDELKAELHALRAYLAKH